MAEKTESAHKPTPYETITANVLEQMQKPMEPWERPWARPGLTLPINAATGRGYNGVNVPVLWGAGDGAGYPESRWATFNQWKQQGAAVRRGEHGTPVIWFKMYEPNDGRRVADGADAGGGDGDERGG